MARGARPSPGPPNRDQIATGDPPPDPSQMSYEQAIEALETIIEQIEEGTIGLEDSIEAYRRGTALIRRCREILDKAQQQIETISTAADDAADEKPDADRPGPASAPP